MITGVVMLLAGIPFWFLPKSLPKQGEGDAEKKLNAQEGEQDTFIPDKNKQSSKPSEVSMRALAKGIFVNFMRCLYDFMQVD